jgi:hypothetical protein
MATRHGELNEFSQAYLFGAPDNCPIKATDHGKAPLDHVLGRKGASVAP